MDGLLALALGQLLARVLPVESGLVLVELLARVSVAELVGDLDSIPVPQLAEALIPVLEPVEARILGADLDLALMELVSVL
jgi:hypothetical protein